MSHCFLAIMMSFATAVDADTFAAERLEKTEPARWEIAYEFVDRMGEAEVVHPPQPGATHTAVGGVAKACIGQHPALHPGEPAAELLFGAVPLPEIAPGERLLLHFFIAIREGFDPADAPNADGCAFVVLLDGAEAFRREHMAQEWAEWVLDLTPRAGGTVAVTFITEALSNSQYDWAVWGQPRVLIEGRPRTMKTGPRIDLLRHENLERAPVPDRVFHAENTTDHWTGIAVADEFLDLATQIRRTTAETGAPPVSLPPPMVAGEGPHRDNHTLVRVFDAHGLAQLQFLAYPETVRGGVQVGTGRAADGSVFIATAPCLSAEDRTVRVFTPWGGPVAAFDPGQTLIPPYYITTGRFLPEAKGDVLVVAHGDTALLFHPDGRPASTPAIGLPFGIVAMTTARYPVGDRLLASSAEGRWAEIDPASGVTREGRVGAGKTTHQRTPGDDTLWAAGPGELLSEVTEVGTGRILDVGRHENRFWYQWGGGPMDGGAPFGSGERVRKSRFLHLRTDVASDGFDNPDADPDDPEAWIGPHLRGMIEHNVGSYDTELPGLWEPCFTHRMPKDPFKPWSDVVDPETGMRRHTTLTRNNNVVEYGEFDTVGFTVSTYAFGLPELDSLYIRPIRAFLRELAPAFRRNPEHFVGVEPNHEHEIAVDAEGTKGDYNPRIITGFHDHLRRVRGMSAEDMVRVFGLPDDGWFDAPRDWERGDWDRYSEDNPFYAAWVDYQRYVVNRRIAETLREGLLAGFPPESIKTHQIPDTYAIGNLDAFSSVTSRYTPIDYVMNAGTGYGFTRYTVWHRDRFNVMQGAWTSGFGLTTIGEYQALTSDPDEAWNQLRYIFDMGGYAAHCMVWPEGYDQGYNATMASALRRLVEEDPVRPGVTGGVGGIRAGYDRSGEPITVVCLGEGPDHNGLLKSVDPEGNWDGRAYVTPFRAHVAVEPQAVEIEDNEFRVGPLAGLDSGAQIEVVCEARGGAVTFLAEGPEGALAGTEMTAPAGADWKSCRFVFRVPLPIEDVVIRAIASPGAEVRAAKAWRQTEQTTKLAKNLLEGTRHRGGVMFDLMPVR